MTTKLTPPEEENNNTQENNTMNEENQDDTMSQISKFKATEPPNIIELGQASELLALPPELVTALCYSGLIEEHHKLAEPQTLLMSLDDVIRVDGLLKRYRGNDRDGLSERHEHEVRGILEHIGGYKLTKSQHDDQLTSIFSEYGGNYPPSN